jgi:UDP-4-amino-4,6-dideoxy-N-acetyl-beta-L-altrosamine N-acetyltransferase
MYRLRELEKKDLAEINRWRNNPELIRFLGAPFRFINLDVDEQWFENYMANRGNSVRCAIVESENDLILGLVSLTSVDYLNQCAEFHIMIGAESNCGKGAGTFAVKKMLDHAFNNMNLQRVELGVLKNNERAKHLYEKCGFVLEGCRRKAKYKNGGFVDMMIYSILKSEFNRENGCPALTGGGGRHNPNLSTSNSFSARRIAS